MSSPEKTLYICSCGSLQHMFVVFADGEDLFFEIHLSPLPFWKRVRKAFSYILGKRSEFGDFEEVILTPEMALDLGDRLVEWSSGVPYEFPTNDVH